MRIDRERVLNMWAAGIEADAIVGPVGASHRNSIHKIISMARVAGDPRAARRPNNGARIVRERDHMRLGRIARLKRIARLPYREGDIERAIASYSGPVTKLPAGFHSGHVPRCLKAITF